MAISNWMIWGRRLHTNRPHRGRHEYESSCIQLDLSKELKENIREVLFNVCQRQGISTAKKLAYLNAIIRLISENDAPDYGYCTEEVFCCLRVALINEATQVRAAALRAVRYMIKSDLDVVIINKLHYPYFVARSMDVNLRNDMERMQALRLVRRILVIAPSHFSPVLARSLISLTIGGIEERERTFRVFLATLCELGVLNSRLLISCGGVGALARSAMTVQSPAVIESVVGVLLHLLDNPETRGSVSLLCLASPYCELHSLGQERSRESREMRFASSKQALLSVLRSYTGVIHFCHPNNNSGLKAIVEILYVDQLEVRGAVLEFLYELLGLPLPMWTDEPDVAVAAVDPSRPRETWKLSEGFVAAEGKMILPVLTSRCPNIMEVHLALLVYVLLQCGLHDALTATILSSDTFISVRAAVLLGILLHLAHSLLPPEICDLTPPLPNLLEHASAGRHQALTAVTILGRIHTLMQRRLAPTSLFLDRILRAGAWLRPTLPSRRQRISGRTWLRRHSPTTPLLKDAQVLSSKDALAWNWPVIRSILRSREDSLCILHDSDHRVFIKRLVRYFKPSSNRYSRVELVTSATLAREATLAGCDLVNCLLEMNEPEGAKLLNELIGDIAEQISAITTLPSAHDCLFSPRHMTTTCCQKYFLFLGQLSHSAKGTVILKGFNLLEKLQDLALATNHDCYLKLIVSSLDYSRDGPNRKVMCKIINDATIENTRLYATQFLRLILGAKMTDAYQWAIALLCSRLTDASKIVALAALDILHDACNEPAYLETLFQYAGRTRDWNSWLRHLGDAGYLLKIRMYALRSAFTSLASASEELERWTRTDGFAERYVGLVEGKIHDSMTRRQRDENGTYLRRSTNMLVQPKDIFVPSHLIGQFVQHELGVQLILRRNVLQRFARTIQHFKLECAGHDGTTETNSRGTRSTRSVLDDSNTVSEESGAEDNATSEPNRLETIIDAEIMETVEDRGPMKTESCIETPRKLSIEDAERTTPEKFSREKRSVRPQEIILKVKAALWALGHAGTSTLGVEQLNNLGIIEMITCVAETCPHYTVRATALYALSLIATTRAGADSLMNLDWPCVRYKRGDQWPVVEPTNSYRVPSPVPVQRHHRSLSDGKPEIPVPLARRTRNRSESAATDVDPRRYALPERGETPSPVLSVQRLSQQDADGYARLRSLQRHRRPSYSHSSLEMHSSEGRLSLQSLSEFESSRSWTTDNGPSATPPPPRTTEEETHGPQYMGICLPRRLTMVFPDLPRGPPSAWMDDCENTVVDDTTNRKDESVLDCDIGSEHSRVCLVCCQGKTRSKDESVDESEMKLRREILRHTQRLSNPVWYRYSRQPLLRLRQRYPEKFQDTCLYSEVAARLGCGTYRLPARRFLQELFLDSPFEALYKEPMTILKMPIGTEETSAQIAGSGRYGDPHRLPASSPPGRKLNGKLAIAETAMKKVQEIDIALTGNNDGPSESENGKPSLSRHKTSEAAEKKERPSDEKIILEILNPVAKKAQLSKSSDKLLKASVIDTAIHLD